MKLLVVGDYITDRYVFGTAVRLCPEAPVPVVIPQIERESHGGAGLVWAQLLELETIKPGEQTQLWVGSKSVKERFFVGNHLVCRVDRDGLEISNTALRYQDMEAADALVISDYGKGAMTPALAHIIVETGKPCFVDAKHHWHWYRGQNVTIFPNQHECLDETFMLDQIVRKLGKDGCEYRNVHLAATVSEVVDTTGAGDIFMASFVYAWTLQLPAEDCLRLANALAGESCRHVGTYVVPKAFAEAYLGRLRASKESPSQIPAIPGCSIPLAPLPQHERGHWGYRASAFPEADSLHASWRQEQAAQATDQDIHADAQTLPVSPSDPTASPATRIQPDRESSDESDTK